MILFLRMVLSARRHSEYESILYKFIRLIDGNLTGTTILVQRGSGSNGNEKGILHSSDIRNWSLSN